jgi:hypothetical protein
MRLVAACVLAFAVSLNGYADETWENHPEWSGEWKATPEVSRLLGFKDEKGDSLCPETLELRFLVSKDAAVAFFGEGLLEVGMRRLVRYEHEVIAAGSWKDQEVPNDESMCFVTRKTGATYLWFRNDMEYVSVAKVHYIRGVDPEDDMLVLDPAGFMEKRPQGKEEILRFKAVSYRRKMRDGDTPYRPEPKAFIIKTDKSCQEVKASLDEYFKEKHPLYAKIIKRPPIDELRRNPGEVRKWVERVKASPVSCVTSFRPGNALYDFVERTEISENEIRAVDVGLYPDEDGKCRIVGRLRSEEKSDGVTFAEARPITEEEIRRLIKHTPADAEQAQPRSSPVRPEKASD